MTLAEINRMIRAAIRAAKKEGASVVEVTIGGEAIVRIPLVPDKPIAADLDLVNDADALRRWGDGDG